MPDLRSDRLVLSATGFGSSSSMPEENCTSASASGATFLEMRAGTAGGRETSPPKGRRAELHRGPEQPARPALRRRRGAPPRPRACARRGAVLVHPPEAHRRIERDRHGAREPRAEEGVEEGGLRPQHDGDPVAVPDAERRVGRGGALGAAPDLDGEPRLALGRIHEKVTPDAALDARASACARVGCRRGGAGEPRRITARPPPPAGRCFGQHARRRGPQSARVRVPAASSSVRTMRNRSSTATTSPRSAGRSRGARRAARPAPAARPRASARRARCAGSRAPPTAPVRRGRGRPPRRDRARARGSSRSPPEQDSSAEKPGPSPRAGRRRQGGRPSRRGSPRARTAPRRPRFPTSRSERQERSSAAGGSARARPKASITFGPPVWATQWRTSRARARGRRGRRPRRRRCGLDHLGRLRGEDHLEAAVDDVPAKSHLVSGYRTERVATTRSPARRLRGRRPRARPPPRRSPNSPRIATRFATEASSRSSVSGEADRQQHADFAREGAQGVAGAGRGPPRRRGSRPEDGGPLHRRLQAEAVRELCVEQHGGDAGHGDGGRGGRRRAARAPPRRAVGGSPPSPESVREHG